MKHFLIAFTILGATLTLTRLTAFAAEDEAAILPTQQRPIAQSTVRQETLELPGLTACHQCEWRPHLHEQAAPEQCGTTPDGRAKIGQFECGFSPDCERVCNFVTCAQ